MVAPKDRKPEPSAAVPATPKTSTTEKIAL